MSNEQTDSPCSCFARVRIVRESIGLETDKDREKCRSLAGHRHQGPWVPQQEPPELASNKGVDCVMTVGRNRYFPLREESLMHQMH